MTAIEDALAAMKRMDDLKADREASRLARNDAIWRAHTEDGMRPPDIARALGGEVSESLVRHVLTLEKATRKKTRRRK